MQSDNVDGSPQISHTSALSHFVILTRRVKDKKVGEGTYAVVYQGACHKQLVEEMLS